MPAKVTSIRPAAPDGRAASGPRPRERFPPASPRFGRRTPSQAPSLDPPSPPQPIVSKVAERAFGIPRLSRFRCRREGTGGPWRRAGRRASDANPTTPAVWRAGCRICVTWRRKLYSGARSAAASVGFATRSVAKPTISLPRAGDCRVSPPVGRRSTHRRPAGGPPNVASDWPPPSPAPKSEKDRIPSLHRGRAEQP
jgi:hypothetical protein